MKRIDPWRRNVCAQHYYISRLKYGPGKWADLRGYSAEFIPLDRDAAMILVTRPDKIMAGPAPLRSVFRVPQDDIRISEIEYVVSACAGGKIVTEDFVHPFKKGADLEEQADFWLMTPAGNDYLFTTRNLDDMLGVRVFGPIQGAQFCC